MPIAVCQKSLAVTILANYGRFYVLIVIGNGLVEYGFYRLKPVRSISHSNFKILIIDPMSQPMADSRASFHKHQVVLAWPVSLWQSGKQYSTSFWSSKMTAFMECKSWRLAIDSPAIKLN